MEEGRHASEVAKWPRGTYWISHLALYVGMHTSLLPHCLPVVFSIGSFGSQMASDCYVNGCKGSGNHTKPYNAAVEEPQSAQCAVD